MGNILEEILLKDEYLSIIRLIERLHRQFLEVVKGEIDRQGILDINGVQALILYNIGDDELTVGELTQRGYYLGSNVSYNVKKMVDNGYIIQERSAHDRRSIRISLSDQGKSVRQVMNNVLKLHSEKLADDGLTLSELENITSLLSQLEQFLLNSHGYNPIKSFFSNLKK